MNLSLSIVVPAHNESDNLKRLIPELIQALAPLGSAYEVLVVDNASTDETQNTLNALKNVYAQVRSVFEKEKGFGRTLLRGLRDGRGEVLGYIHADNQMSPSEVLRIYEKLMSEGLDVCKAARVNRNDGPWRFMVSKVYNALFRLMFLVTARDINGSPKLFTKRFFDAAKLQSLDWFIDPEILIKAKRLGAKVGDVEIRTFRRESGVSKVRLATILEFFRNMYRYWRNQQSHREEK